MTSVELTGFERLEKAINNGANSVFRLSIPAQIATVVAAPVFSWFVWRGSGLQYPVSWLFLATVWVYWYFYLLSPAKVSIDGSSVTLRWWYRRATVVRSAVSLEARPSAASKLFGYDCIVVGGTGRFPIWPAWFLVEDEEGREGSS
jgi:hypothetical protein